MLERYVNWQFNTLGDPELELMLSEVKGLAEDILAGKPQRWLSMCGSSGAGKTHLSKKLLSLWRTRLGVEDAQGAIGTFTRLRESKFISWVKFLSRQRSGEFGELQELSAVPFLVIDDVGAEHDPSGFAKARLYELLDARLGKWTVITSNLSVAALAGVDVRIASRLTRGGSVVLDLNVKDWGLR
jgi:DNA replication protein DnaC